MQGEENNVICMLKLLKVFVKDIDNYNYNSTKYVLTYIYLQMMYLIFIKFI